MVKQFIKDHSRVTFYSTKLHRCGTGMITKTTPVWLWGTKLNNNLAIENFDNCSAPPRSPPCCLVFTHSTSLEWRLTCAPPPPPPSWCASRCPPVSLGSSPAMTASVSLWTSDATRYQTAGQLTKLAPSCFKVNSQGWIRRRWVWNAGHEDDIQ